MNTRGRATIVAIGTAVPEHKLEQHAFARWIAGSFDERAAIGRWFRSICANSGIDTRYTCVPDYLQPPDTSRFAPSTPVSEAPTTAERMAIYERASVPLGVDAGRRALTHYAQTSDTDLSAVAESVTHLVVVSCTGFFAPGLDIAIARELDLPDDVERTLIGFMGCAAAFNGLRTATQIVQGRPSARVLVVCVEICSIHLQPNDERENLISASLFADGASACLVADRRAAQRDAFEIGTFYTGLKPETEAEMIWEIGDHGFILGLSPQIPEHLAETAPPAVETLFENGDSPQFWAIHPGGRAIVDRLADIFDLAPDDVAASRAVLRDVGNLSSATIFFVLAELRRRLREQPDGGSRDGVAMAFGPGLVIEMARLTYVPGDDVET